MIRNRDTRRRYGTTLVVWGLGLAIYLTVLFGRTPILTYIDVNGTLDWRLALPTLAVVIAAGFLLRLASHRHPQREG